MMVFSAQLGEGGVARPPWLSPPPLAICRPLPSQTSERMLPVLSLVASLEGTGSLVRPSDKGTERNWWVDVGDGAKANDKKGALLNYSPSLVCTVLILASA